MRMMNGHFFRRAAIAGLSCCCVTTLHAGEPQKDFLGGNQDSSFPDAVVGQLPDIAKASGGLQPRGGACATTSLAYEFSAFGGQVIEINTAAQPNQRWGDTLNLCGGPREICQVDLYVAILAADFTPADLTIQIWDDCPTAGGPSPAGDCGTGPGTLLATATETYTPAQVGFFELRSFTFDPPLSVPGTIVLNVHSSRTGVYVGFNATIGTGSSPLALNRCGHTTQNLCNGTLGAFTHNFTVDIHAVEETVAGACCLPDGTCADLLPCACEQQGGISQGAGSDCASLPPGACNGACCLTNGTCNDNVSAGDCATASGTFFGPGSLCADEAPNGCVGACCAPDGTCSDISEDACAAGGGTYFGLGTACADVEPCLGACCAPDGTCVDSTQDACGLAGNDFQGYGTACATTVCFIVQNCPAGFSGQATDNEGHGATGVVAATSDLNPEFGFRVAENFTASADGTITSLKWWGIYNDFDSGAACSPQDGDSPDDFKVTFYHNLLDLPSNDQAVIASFSVTPTETFTGNQIVGRNVYLYEATLPAGVAVEANTCYWIEIVNNTSGACAWLWRTAPAGDLKSAQTLSVAGPYVAGDESDYDLSFCMDFGVNADGCESDIEATRACCPPPGAGGCVEVGPSDCLALNGQIGGPDSVCTATACDGACCVSDGQGGFNCSITPEITCFNNGGVWNGAFSTCESQPCSGACCLFDGTCNEGVSLITCASFAPAGGVYYGGLACSEVNCGSTLICDATLLACGGSTTVDNTALASAAPQPPQPVTHSCFGGGAAVGVGSFWVSFVGDGQDVKVSLCNSDVSDTVLSVYTRADNNCGAISDADEVACSEDVTGCGGGLLSEVCVPASVVGQTYWALISSFDANSAGTIQVDITCPCEDCGTCPGDVSGDNTRDGIDVQAFVDCALGLSQDCGCADLDSDNDVDVDDAVLLAGELVNATGVCP